jgi:hypothetical protein
MVGVADLIFHAGKFLLTFTLPLDKAAVRPFYGEVCCAKRLTRITTKQSSFSTSDNRPTSHWVEPLSIVDH